MASLFVMLLLVVMAFVVRGKLVNYDQSVIPETKLTTRTFFEVFVGYWYGMMKDMMGPKRAKRYFPLIGSLACFIFFSNALGLVPGFTPPTSNWNVTMGCALVVFVMFNYYGFKENGFGYVKHLFGPYIGWWAIPINILLFVVEIVSTLIRPLTLSIRLMLNMAVDHLLVTLTLGMIALFLPVPVLVLGTLVVLVQVHGLLPAVVDLHLAGDRARGRTGVTSSMAPTGPTGTAPGARGRSLTHGPALARENFRALAPPQKHAEP